MGAGERSSHQAAIGRPDLRDAGDMEKLSPDCLFEFMPQFVSVAQQGDIGGMFEVSKSNDARQAMGGATVVTWGVTLEPQHLLASARQMLNRRAPHRAQAADHHIEMSHTVGPAIRYSNSSEGGCAFATAKELPPQIKSGAGLGRNCCAVVVCGGQPSNADRPL